VDSEARLRAYISAWESYLRTKEVTAFENEATLQLLANFDDSLEVKAREIRAAELRKFVFSVEDDLYLAKVHDAVEALGRIPNVEGAKETLLVVLARIQTGHTGPVWIHEGDGEPTPDSSIVRQAIYGGFLHGDLLKREVNVTRHPTTINLALFGWISFVEGVCQVVYNMAKQSIS